MNLATLLIIAAIVVFVLVAVSVAPVLPWAYVGFACFAAGHLPWPV